jgi:hypothetical protein
MPRVDKDTVARRVEALRLTRVSSVMEGWRERPNDGAGLDAFARGEIDRAQFMCRVSVEFRGRRAHT